MNRRGFALLEILIVAAVIALVAGGGWYVAQLQSEQASVKNGQNAEQQAQQAVRQANGQTQAEQNALNQAMGVGTSSSPAAAVATGTGAYAGLGSDKYADGILPLGDGKYSTAGPQKGYIYVCDANMTGGGAQGKAPWIGTSTWNAGQKIHVEGSVTWSNASVSISVNGSTRTIATNDLPKDTPTGIFPIQRSDPAYQYDANPNSIEAQSLSYALPAAPQFAAAPSCLRDGPIGVMTNGVLLFDGFDAELRDAAAHEVQDLCDGHPQSGGMYHYHGPSPCLTGNATTVIGFALDGFPITGSSLGNGRSLTTADLDECHGITGPITLEGKTVTMYHYVMTQDFPYSLGCYRGTPVVKGAAGGQAAPASGTSGAGSVSGPPAAAVAACANESSAAACSFETPQGTVSGSCRVPPGGAALVCVPN